MMEKMPGNYEKILGRILENIITKRTVGLRLIPGAMRKSFTESMSQQFRSWGAFQKNTLKIFLFICGIIFY